MFLVNGFKSLLSHNITSEIRVTQVCWKSNLNRPIPRNPIWFYKKERAKHDENITEENRNFIRDVVHEKFGTPVINKGLLTYQKASSLLKTEVIEPVEWRTNFRRTGLIARKIGHYPLWLKNGERIDTTILQVVDNHVVKYTPPEEFNPSQIPRVKNLQRFGCLLVGSESVDPTVLTADYMGLFKGSGVMPKRNLSRFIISPEAAMLPGTPLNVTHFRVGDYVDVRGKTVYHGFQGVCFRHGFKGQPKSHGVTKTHRRPGNIGGGIKHRVWPGTKLPGHMGNRWRKAKGLKIWRINTKTNTMWVSGVAIPGDPNSLVYIYDTILPLRQPKTPPHFPTFLGTESEQPDDIWSDDLHKFSDPTIVFDPEK